MAPLIIAHRGARSLAPENTLSAARKAHAVGADLWELDVAFTKDDALILCHDDNLDRTLGVSRKFWELTLEEHRALAPGRHFLETDPFGQIAAGNIVNGDKAELENASVATLQEALQLTRDLNWKVNIELKRNPAHHPDYPILTRVFELIDAENIGPKHVLFSSAIHEWLDEIKRTRPEFEVQPIVALWPHNPADFGDRRFDTYNVRRTRVFPDDVKRAVDQGLAVNVYVVNEEEDMRAFTLAGAAGLITDFPQRLRTLIQEGRL